MNPWEAEIRIDIELAKHLIGSQFPELLPLQIKHKGEGWDNVVLQVNEEYLFRFPRREIAVDLLKNEARILPKIRSKLPLPIPELVFQGLPNSKYPWPFLGYRLLDGITACQAHLNQTERQELIPVLADFLSKLHQISEEEAKSFGAVSDQLGRLDIKKRIPQVLDYLKKLKELRLCSNLEPLYSIVSQTRDLGEIQSLCNERSPKKVLLHGDLYVRHLLIGPHRSLAGIIDWGDIHYGDPALDLQVVFTVLPPSSHRSFFDKYGAVSDETWILARFRALLSTFVTTVYAHSIGDMDLLQEGKLGLEYLSQHVQRA